MTIKLNIFRNPYIDAQIGYFMDNFDQAVRNQTEDYWRNTIADEVLQRCPMGLLCPQCAEISKRIRNG
jgi:hypothetical protein